MDIILSQRVQKIKPSPTLAVSQKAAQLRAEGKDVIGLGTGEPDFDTPEHIKQAAIRALQDGYTKYTPVDGIPQLKQAIADKFKRDNELNYEPDQVLVSVGGKQSIFNLCQAYLNDGDEVLIPAPYWVSYPDMAILAGGKPVFINTTIEDDFKVTAEQIEAAITPKTKLIFFNSPSNPSGKTYRLDELKAIGEVLLKHPHVLIATDDMYEHIVWSIDGFHNILNATPELYDRTIVLNGVSKAYSMTGWRIGYAAGPQKLITAMKKIQSQSTSNPCSIAQYAALEALNGPQDCLKEMLNAFKARHDFVYERLGSMDGVSVIPSDGTFYIFPDFSEIIARKGLENDIAFAEALLQEVGVAVVPGSAFGNEGCIRLSFATSNDILNEALDRIQKYVLDK
jgi:aspartate aminotransferase